MLPISILFINKYQDKLKTSDKMINILVLELKLSLVKKSLFVINIYNVLTRFKYVSRYADILINVPKIL